tara:strand:+ start:232 stop:453 length:222 start_codon:yes stop_codon:yes gene_type:complete
MKNFIIPEYKIEYSDKHNVQYLKIYIMNNYQVIEEIQFENLQAVQTYAILISNNEQEIKEIFIEIYNNYMEGI